MSKKAAGDSVRKLSNASTCSTEALSEIDQSESCASTKPAETSWFDMALHHVGGLVSQLPHAAQVGDALQALTSYPREQETREALALKDEQLVRAAAEAAAAKRRVEELTQQLLAAKVAKAGTSARRAWWCTSRAEQHQEEAGMH
jgi:hypothetical protein